jgi:hypothetical protein
LFQVGLSRLVTYAHLLRNLFTHRVQGLSALSLLSCENLKVGVFLRNSRWDWEKRSGKGEQLGLGMYPHLEVSDAAATVEKARKAGYRVVQEPREYDFGTEAFIADPDGYTWALVSPPKVASGR